MSKELRLEIASTWDGHAISPNEQAVVTLRPAPAPGALLLRVDAPWHGDPPPAGEPGPTWALWEHEVVEFFVAGPGDEPHYLEIELGPHGHHLALQLEGRRNVVARELPMTVTCVRKDTRWTATATVPRAWLPDGPRRVNAYAIHGVGDARRYLAAQPVPGDGPDFHRIEHFVAAELP